MRFLLLLFLFTTIVVAPLEAKRAKLEGTWQRELLASDGSDAFFEAEARELFDRLLLESMSFSPNPTPMTTVPNPSTPSPSTIPPTTEEMTSEPTTPSPTPGTLSPSPGTTIPPTTEETTSEPTTPPTPGTPSPSPGTLSPTSEPPEECETSYIHCGDAISTCFIDLNVKGGGNGGPWGWSIDLNTVDLSDNKSLICQVYTGAGQCDYQTKGQNVGIFVISEDSVKWNFASGFGALDVHLYGGKCQLNDKGDHLTNSGNVCDAKLMGQNARTPGQYTLLDDSFSPLVSEWTFDESNHNDAAFRKGIWNKEDYLLFPVTGADRRYLAAHATVCPCSTLNGCTATTASLEEIPDNAEKSGPAVGLGPAATTGIVVAGLVVAVAVGLFAYGRKKYASGSVSSDSSASSGYTLPMPTPPNFDEV